MTRELYINELDKCKNKDCSSAVRIAYIKSLEQRIVELETQNKDLNLEIVNIELKLHTGSYLKTLESPNTCEGCKHFFKDAFEGCKLYEKDFTKCSRQFNNDYYEPKDTE